MYVYEPLRHDWSSFCQRFTAQHRGERFRFAAGATPAPGGLHTLRSLEFEPGTAKLAIHFGDDRDAEVVWAPAVSELSVEQPEGGLGGQLQVRFGLDDSLTLQFENALLPGALDGIAAHELPA